ncbi:MAG: hypothetical protein J7M38_13615, partial [Armatimonadetes bacterium]|nr:hypothetical protein [Armatimonadota bacterium]
MSEGPYDLAGLPQVHAGAAQVEITPPVGTSLAGYFRDRVSDGVADPLFAHALVFDSGGNRIALVSCDLICITRDTTDPARQLIAERTGIAPENVLISCTHTHTGPNTRRRGKQIIPVNEQWLDELPEMIASAVEAACADMFDAVLIPGRRFEDELGSNRLGRMRDSSEVFSKTDAIGPAGPIDPELLALAVREPDGTMRAMVVNYAMHADATGGNRISAGWPGKVARTIAQVYGDQCVTLFLNGCCGDINHHHWEPRRIAGKGQLRTDQMGRAVGGLAINAVEIAEPMEAAEIDARLRTPAIPWYTRDDEMRAEIEALRAQEQLSEMEATIIKRFDEWPYDNQMAEVTVQALRLGDIIFVGLPGEIFVEWGLEIKHWSPAKYTFIAELANDWFGYIPT